MSSFVHFRSSCFQEETQASSFFECLPRYFLSIHWHHALWCHHIYECESQQMHLAAQLMRSSWAPTISLGSHQNIGLHTGAHANVVLLTYLLNFKLESEIIYILEISVLIFSVCLYLLSAPLRSNGGRLRFPSVYLIFFIHRSCSETTRLILV